jgi:hypothetical protein
LRKGLDKAIICIFVCKIGVALPHPTFAGGGGFQRKTERRQNNEEKKTTTLS